MSVDTFAVLEIKKLVAPRDETLGAPLPVMHRGDASIVSAWTRYGGSWGRWRSASTYRQTVLADWRSASRLSRGAVLPVLG